MKYLIAILSSCIVAYALPSYPYPSIYEGVGAIYKGPNSETIIKGPDGSIITSEAIGGHIAIGDTPHVQQAPIIHQAPIQHAPLVQEPLLYAPLHHSAGPVILPNLGHLGQAHAHIDHSGGGSVLLPSVGHLGPAPLILQNNPIVVDDPKIVEEHILVGNKIITVPKKVEENTDLIGPSGTISTRGGDVVISGPASTTIKGGGVVSSIDKQSDINIKSIEIKPVSIPIALAPVIETQSILQAGPIISEPRPIVRPIYAEAAPVYSVNPLLVPNTPIVHVDQGSNGAISNGNHGFRAPAYANLVADQLSPHHLNAHQLVNQQFTAHQASAPSLTVPTPNLGPVLYDNGLQATINQADLNFINAGHLLNQNAGPHYPTAYASPNSYGGLYGAGPHYHNSKPLYRGPAY